MRILALSLKNLNSLQGEWHIDFRHPDYADNGIFAITGQTGAGKSTILDAICLALYGQTPRLGELTQTKNDLMSRQTGECWAKVIFSTQGTTYLCEWSQHKASKKPNGKLQPHYHAISYYEEDEAGENKKNIIESKIKSTKPKIQEITGMDFQQFTRSMLLAQGSFAVFLQAKSEERSEILEQITGTEIYTDISIRVNSHRSEAKKDLDNLNAQLSGMMILTAEEEQQLLEKQKDLTNNITQIKHTIDTLSQIKNWQLTLQATQAEQAKNQHELTQIQQAITEFAPQRQRLSLAQKALEVAGEYAKFQHNREHHAKLSAQQQDFQHQQPMLQQQVSEQQQQLRHALTAKNHTETAWQTAQPKLNTAKTLAVQIGELEQQHRHAEQQHIAHINEQIELASVLENGKIELDELHHTQTQQRQEQHTLTNHADLLMVLADLRQHQATLTARDTQLATLQQQRTQSQNALNTLGENLTQTQHQLSNLAEQTTQTQQQLTTQNQQLQHLLVGKTSDDWHAHANTLLKGKNTLSQIGQTWQTIGDLTQEKTVLEQTQHQTQLDLQHLEQQNATLENTYQKQSQLVEMLIDKQLLQAKIDDLKSERNNLVDGEPCPLCGATEHPFASQNFTTQADHIKTELATAKKQLQNLEKEYKTASLQQNSLSEKLQQIQQTLAKINPNLTKQFEQLKQLVSEFSQIFVAEASFSEQENAIFAKIKTFATTENQEFFKDNFATVLAECVAMIENNQANIAEKISQIQPLQHTITQLKAEFDNQQQTHYQLEKTQTDITNQQAIETQNLNHIATQLEKLEQEFSQILEKIAQNIEPFTDFLPKQILVDFSNQSVKILNQIIDTLTQRHQYWQSLEQALQERERIIIARQSFIQQQTENYEKTAKTLTENAQHLEQKQHIISQKQTELGAVMADIGIKNEQGANGENQAIEQAEKRLTTDLTLAQNAVFTAEKTLQTSEQNLHTLQQNITQLSQELSQLAESVSQQNSHLTQRWHRLGFADETAFLSATLEEAEREQLANTRRHYDERLHFLTQQHNALQEKLATLYASPLRRQAQQHAQQQLQQKADGESGEQAIANIANITAQLVQATTQLETVQQELGAISQKLSHNQQLQTSQSQLVSQIDQQTKIWQNWNNLSELIGSHDGKKFRNFAQGLTFNVMIRHANAQLARMTNRYLLVADTQNPLELNVIDNYQGDEVRTSKNLSGGESFIVSLALALGLSSMASRQVQVDSLFLDEGFGTLDTEALDTALDTLTSLQQTGKLIGVISHVQELKDRITTQIVVEKMHGGVSKITGAGVKQVGN